MKTRILVVEDDPAILRGVTDLLEGEGYGVLTARVPAARVSAAARTRSHAGDMPRHPPPPAGSACDPLLPGQGAGNLDEQHDQ